MKPTLLVLAAGMGSRYGGLKQLDSIGPSGETIIDYSLFDAINAGFGKIVFVIRKSIQQEFTELIVDKIKHLVAVEIAFQELDNLPVSTIVNPERQKPWGTGHAIWVAKDFIKEPFAVINADDFYGNEAFNIMVRYLSNLNEKNQGDYAMCGYKLGNTLSENGSVSRGVCQVSNDCMLLEIKEQGNIFRNLDERILAELNGQITELDDEQIVSMNFWGFTTNIFTHLETKLTKFILEKGNQLKSELFIPTVVHSLMEANQVTTRVFTCNEKWFGVTYKKDKPIVVHQINELIDKGKYPRKLF